MSNIVRVAKSGNDWTQNELLAYNIEIRILDDKLFFGRSLGPLPQNLNKDILEYEFKDGEHIPDEIDELLSYLDLASTATRGQESMVDDFARELLKSLGFQKKGRLLRTRHSIPLIISGESKVAQTDVCIINRNKGLLILLQEDKRLISIKDPEPQVIAEAIAAFQENNRIRHERGLERLERMTIPCITMIGTFPRFYLVPVTRSLNECVITGQYPIEKTAVSMYVPNTSRRQSDGMKPLNDRKRIIQCYELFKKFVDDIEEILS